MVRIGLISDTHGLLRPAALDWLQGSDRIVHAGDVCAPEVLQALSAIAPVTAVRGNNDVGAWAEELQEIERLEIEGVSILVVHDLAQLGRAGPGEGVQVVVSGHSHKPVIEQRGPVLYVNPGSAGPRRFKLPIAAGELRIERGSVKAAIQQFDA